MCFVQLSFLIILLKYNTWTCRRVSSPNIDSHISYDFCFIIPSLIILCMVSNLTLSKKICRGAFRIAFITAVAQMFVALVIHTHASFWIFENIRWIPFRLGTLTSYPSYSIITNDTNYLCLTPSFDLHFAWYLNLSSHACLSL